MNGHTESRTVPLPLARLVTDIRAAVRTGGADNPEHTARSVARTVAPHLGGEGLLTPEQLEPDWWSYRQHVLHVEPDGLFSIVALVWLPGQRTAVHDHLAWCVTGVHLGAEEEIHYRLAADGDQAHLVPIEATVHEAGAVDFLVPPGDIHEVRNAADHTSVSIHVYGTDLRRSGSSIRRTYALSVRAAELTG
ncbi:cysteine dioxygenase family protein [Streptomyces sp. TRM76323]|uniref:Cysteine dioxygenase family protein n=1 Tax=Streptomyces tamarix TaxID=3078565 RepID=A0ABU3QQI6_9ACTN|nr:cysteine dioxygenase family protein [Streptomyces tamarix]MDT9685025.1 cysteine dioxygenase family protein [Streptomyces tamarix]